MRNRWWLLTLILTLAVSIATAGPVLANVLTSNVYTYIMQGRELDIAVDILTQRGTQMVPAQLLSQLGLSLQADGERILLERGPVTVELRLGVATALVDDHRQPLKTGPVRISNRIFIPAEVLPQLGVQLEVDGKFVFVTDYGASAPALAPVQDSQNSLASRSFRTQVRDGSQMGELEVTHLTEELLLDPSLPIPWGTRMQLFSLIGDRTLFLVTLRNQAIKTMALDPGKLSLIGSSGRQYDYLKQEIPIDGHVSTAVAPGAARTSVLIYPAMAEAVVDFYYDPAGSIVGRLPVR